MPALHLGGHRYSNSVGSHRRGRRVGDEKKGEVRVGCLPASLAE